MIVLLDDLVCYGLNFDMFFVVRVVRMSCSILYFFELIKLKMDIGIVMVVDGGVLSNFLIWLFLKERKCLVIGVMFVLCERECLKKNICNVFELFGVLFEMMKDVYDVRYIVLWYE